jgi:hypothetical protein
MATVKIKFRVSSIETKAGTLYYQVIHNRLEKPRDFDPFGHAGLSPLVTI